MTMALRAQHCIAFGVRFRLAADSDGLLATMMACAPFGTASCGPAGKDSPQIALTRTSEGTVFRLTHDGETVADGTDLDAILEDLARELMVYVANHAPDRVFIHAGVVGWRGSALVLPGTSFAGKTTLVAALVRAGATYYSDEYAVLDEHGWVHPYARDLQMRNAGRPEQRPVAVAALNGCAGIQPLPVSHVVFTEYAEAGHWSPKPVSPGMAVLDMLRHAIPVQRSPARVMATLAKMMEAATALRSARGDAQPTARALLARMGAKVGR